LITVAGGTGRLGTLVVGRLRDAGLPVRALTRDASRAAHLGPLDVEVRVADVRHPDTLPGAVAGSQVVVSAMHGFVGPRGISPRTVDDLGNRALFDAAAEAGADVVMVSVVGAAPRSPFELFEAKYAAEQHLRGVGVPWTIVRSSAFLETWVEVLRETATRSGRPVVFGRGDNPVNFVPVADVADAVASAVLEPEQRGRVVEVVGPEDLTLTELATRVATADGRSLPPRHVPPAVLRVTAATVGRLSPQLGRQVRAALAMDGADLRGPAGHM
jgi:NADH dehydrogenase